MEPVFLGWDEPALPLAARHLLDHYGARGVARMDSAVVVLPGSRAGRRLKEILVEEAGARQLRLVPPRTLTLGQLPELLYEPPMPRASGAQTRLAWAEALRTMPREDLAPVFARLPDSEGPAEWLPLARAVEGLHREVARGAHRFADVARICRSAASSGKLPWDDARRWEVLARVQERYGRIVEGGGLSDPDMARMAALNAGTLQAPGEIWLVGVSELPGVVRRCLMSVQDRVTPLVHAPASEGDAFDGLGCVLPGAWMERTIPLADDDLRVTDQPRDQAEEVARCLAELNGTLAADEITVGVPEPELLPWLEERLAAAGVPARDAAGRDAGRTGPFRLVAAVADLLGEGRWEAFAALTRHPDAGAWLTARVPDDPELGTPGAWLPALDRWYGRHLPYTLPAEMGARGFPGSQSDDGRVVARLLAQLGRTLPGALAEEPAERALSEWVVPTLELLSRAYGWRELDPSRPGDQQTIRALAQLGDAVAAFRNLPPALDRGCAAAGALRLFLDHASGGRIPERPDAAAVELLGWLELHLDDAPATVLTGVNEPRLPESVNGDPFLPDGLRARLGLEDNRLRYARDAYRLTAMIHSTRHLRLVAGRRTGSGDPLRPSRLLFAAPSEAAARRILRFYGEGDEAEGGLAGTGPRGADAESLPGPLAPPPADSAFRLPPEDQIQVPRERLIIRVTDFRQILTDPYGFALSRYRGCRSLDDRAREMDGLVFGDLAHTVLEGFGGSEAVHSTREAEVVEVLEELLQREVRIRFGAGAGYAHPAVRVQVEQLRTRLRRFAAWHSEWIQAGWRVKAVECATQGDGAVLDVDGEPVWIKARIDRVDVHPESGRWAVLDYKTSDKGDTPEATHRVKKDGEKVWVDLQLPLYRWLLPRVYDAAGEAVATEEEAARAEVGYVLLPRSLDAVGEALAGWRDPDFQDALERARDVARVLRRGVLPFDPEVRSRYADPPVDALLGRTLMAAGFADLEEE